MPPQRKGKYWPPIPYLQSSGYTLENEGAGSSSKPMAQSRVFIINQARTIQPITRAKALKKTWKPMSHHAAVRPRVARELHDLLKT